MKLYTIETGYFKLDGGGDNFSNETRISLEIRIEI